MASIRRATAEDRRFLQEMLAVAVDWRSGALSRSVGEVMRDPELARYVTGWPGDRDAGFVMEDVRSVGAAWWRYFPEHDPGYGFFDGATPEVSIGVVADARGQGFGTRLLGTLVEEARRRGLPGLSLSVEEDNPAKALYERLGFVTVDRGEGSLTMLLELPG